MLIALFLFLILLFTWCVLAGGIWHYAIPGLRTGVLQARGRMVLTGAAAEVVGLFAGRP